MARKTRRKATYRPRRRGTRKGMRRKTARRAYMPKRATRRRARRNPKGFLGSPAIPYVVSAGVGAGLALGIENAGLLSRQIPNSWARAAVLAFATALIGGMVTKGKNRQLLYAAAAGMVIPVAGGAISSTVAPILSPMSRTALASKRSPSLPQASALRSASAHAMSARKNVLS